MLATEFDTNLLIGSSSSGNKNNMKTSKTKYGNR